MLRIPKILHYTFGMASDFGGRPWSLVHYACLKSAIERIVPEEIFFYYEFEPTGPWWQLSRRLVTLVKVSAPREIFGRPISHVAHRSDVLRLQKLIEHGGIYLDADVLVQRSFDGLLDHSTVLGQEGDNARWGLANAVILAEAQSPFLRRWLEEYRSFRSTGIDEFWNEHSVKLPLRLALAHPQEITILSHTAFFWPLWTKEHLDWIYTSNDPIPIHDTYANHLWETKAWEYLEGLTPRHVRLLDTNFHKWARPLISDLPDDFGSLSFVGSLKKRIRRTSHSARATGVRVKQSLNAARRRLRPLIIGKKARRREIFRDIYKNHLWGTDSSSKYFSGRGSRGETAEIYSARMTGLLERHAAELNRPITVIDLGCGDFQVGKDLVSKISDLIYVGCDIVPELIEHNSRIYSDTRTSFRCLDIITDRLPDGDVYLVRQVLQHLSNTEVMNFLRRLSCEYLYVTEAHPEERIGPINPDLATGADVRWDWRVGRGRGLELDKPPFCFRTREVFRVSIHKSVIITERVYLD